MNAAPAGSSAPDLARPRRREGWSPARWLILIALVFAAHTGLIFLFGERTPPTPRPVIHVPALQLANRTNELLELRDPTLFAQPNSHDFAGSAWLPIPSIEVKPFRWTESPRWLELSAEKLGTAFAQFVQTNRFAAFQLNLKPPATFDTPVLLSPPPGLAQRSTLRIDGALAQRPMIGSLTLPSWPYADILLPSVVQVLVDATGDVASVVLLSASGLDEADQRALELARNAHFVPVGPRAGAVTADPAAVLTLGRMIFNWHTVPLPATNAPATAP